jgi:hypothetical protein
MKVVNVLNGGKRALVIYTDGRGLVREDNGDGQTGNGIIRLNVSVWPARFYTIALHVA